ncbi:MAG TPA: hypothetical protein DCZ01_07340 [Elusimicrobia bacterium]|nr:MAG: hypothetical protein A2X37_06625 [Elusimicrobia bacterium GWA2_66_18]OGR69300.1 MAG: hypothetical protein A2X40_11305 [Elusimicrobia bacterium GWC2_65_9]HAZ08321.1 hypothetical protein [Elusimicrobiota bacterium]
MDELRIGQLTKEMVVEELRLLGDPCVAAALVVRRTLFAALKDSPVDGTAHARVVSDSVEGAMTALLLADHSLARGAILVLEAVHDVAGECHLDPTECMRAALSALASLRRFVEPARIDDIRLGIEAHYMGAGEVFSEFLKSSFIPVPR